MDDGSARSPKTLKRAEMKKVESHLAEGSGSVKTMIIRVNRHRSPQTVIRLGKLWIKFEKGMARTSPGGQDEPSQWPSDHDLFQ